MATLCSNYTISSNILALKCCLDTLSLLLKQRTIPKKQEIADFMYDALSSRVVAYFVGKYACECYLVDLEVDQETKLVKLSDF